jgi:hypothetical protein
VHREELRELNAERARQSYYAWQANNRVEQLAAWHDQVAAHQAERARWLADHDRTDQRQPAPTGPASRAERRRADRAQARADRATRRSGRAARDQDLARAVGPDLVGDPTRRRASRPARDRLPGRDRDDHHQEREERGQDRALG